LRTRWSCWSQWCSRHLVHTRRRRRPPRAVTGGPAFIDDLKASYTIVIVTHNMQQAARISDRTAFFNLAGTGQPGKLVEYADTAKLFSTPQEQSTEDYVSGRFG